MSTAIVRCPLKFATKAVNYIDAWRDVIEREYWGRPRIAKELNAKIKGFKFSDGHVRRLAEAAGVTVRARPEDKRTSPALAGSDKARAGRAAQKPATSAALDAALARIHKLELMVSKLYDELDIPLPAEQT